MAILNFQKPDKVIMIDSTESHGKFEFRPLEPGYGLTIGNALRRVLLSSLEGYAFTFIKIDGDGMTQVVRFDPQDNLKFSVYLGTGSNPNERELFKVLPAEHFSPCPPNPLIQISAMFSIKKVVLTKDVLAQNSS